MASSVFMRPRARAALAAVSSQQNFIAVATEDELLAALTVLPRSDSACYGRGINIVGDINLSQSLQLAPQHSGITITSSSTSRISSNASIGTAIIANGCNGVTIENLVIGKIGAVSAGSAVSLIAVSGDGLTVRRIKISPNSDLTHLVFFAPYGSTSTFTGYGTKIIECSTEDRTGSQNVSLYFQFGSTQCLNAVISKNIGFWGGIGTPPFSGVIAQRAMFVESIISDNTNLGKIDMSSIDSGGKNTITGNVMKGNIIIWNSKDKNVISCNSMCGFSIDTSLSNGNNSIVGNTNVGTISNAATDAVTSNT